MNGNIFYNRLLEAIRESNISVNSLAKEFGMTQSKLYKQMTGSVKMTIETLQLICSRLPALSAEWLMRGKGEMWIKDGAAGGQAAGCGSILIGHGSAVGGSVTTNVGCDVARRGEPESGIVEELKKNVVTLKAENTLLREQLYKTQEMLMDALGKVR